LDAMICSLPMSDQNHDDDQDDGQQRDKLLLRLLKAPPQPRPKRVREVKGKGIRPDKGKQHRKAK